MFRVCAVLICDSFEFIFIFVDYRLTLFHLEFFQKEHSVQEFLLFVRKIEEKYSGNSFVLDLKKFDLQPKSRKVTEIFRKHFQLASLTILS